MATHKGANGNGQVGTRGIGHPNIYLEKDFASSEGWYVRVETMMPIPDSDFDTVNAWLAKSDTGGKVAADYLIDKVPGDKGQSVNRNARHMVAAAFGFELDSKTGKIKGFETGKSALGGSDSRTGERRPTP
jgi:hypothetical protein